MIKRIVKEALLWGAALVRRGSKPMVVYYHDVGLAYTSMGTPVNVFHEHIKVAKENGYRFLAEADLDGGKVSGKSLLVCFDDGFRGVWDAREYFALERIRPLVFIAVELVGKPGYMTWDEIRDLQNNYGFAFGSHTLSHQTLIGKVIETQVGQNVNVKRDDAWYRRELVESRLLIGRELGKDVNTLCFPCGYFSRAVVLHSAAAGYKILFTCIPGPLFDEIPDCGAVSGVKVVRRNLVQSVSPWGFLSVVRGGMSIFSRRYFKQHFHAV